MGATARAAEVLNECVDVRLRALPEHWFTSDSRSLLGQVLLDLGRVSEAEPHLRETYPHLLRKLGQRHIHTQEALERLIRLCERQGRTEEARALRTRVIPVEERNQGHGH